MSAVPTLRMAPILSEVTALSEASALSEAPVQIESLLEAFTSIIASFGIIYRVFI